MLKRTGYSFADPTIDAMVIRPRGRLEVLGNNARVTRFNVSRGKKIPLLTGKIAQLPRVRFTNLNSNKKIHKFSKFSDFETTVKSEMR